MNILETNPSHIFIYIRCAGLWEELILHELLMNILGTNPSRIFIYIRSVGLGEEPVLNTLLYYIYINKETVPDI